MINKKIYISILSTALISGYANSEAQVTGKFTHEYAEYTDARAAITKAQALGSASARGADAFKSETSARIYIDGEFDDEMGSTYHVELQGFNDGKAVTKYDSNESYTQRDALREAYIDTSYNDWLIRAGKQQVVWGTADGMKLLDSINPTDFSEMAQNQMEDSRIPVWMLNAEKNTEDGGNFQFVVSQPKENIFAGLNRRISTGTRYNGTTTSTASSYGTDNTTANGHDQGHAFLLKGVDSITGKSNGFVNIVPDLGAIAQRFYKEFSATGVSSLGLNPTTVAGFASMTGGDSGTVQSNFDPANRGYTLIDLYSRSTDNDDGYGLGGTGILGGFAGTYDTNLLSASDGFGTVKDSVFEYMGKTTFGTFDAMANAKSQYVFDMPDDDVDFSMRYKNTTENGTNYSLNYSYAFDKNPTIDIAWKNANGETLTTNRTTSSSQTILTLTDSNSKRYGAWAGGASLKSSVGSGIPILTFTQRLARTQNIGGSFDTTIESEEFGPVVIRGEAVYIKDTKSPVMDLAALDIGDLPAALKMEKGDRFKYVIGADITALTNMMVSVQFIQDRNLDYIDTTSTINSNSNSRYTTDYASMHLTNGFNKAEKNKNFYSLYLSKPYGESGQHRWNNIIIFEENGGKWNRLDTEYTIDDNTVATIEYNKYWGDANTQFGQLEKASNIQVGLKYSF